ncbi:MAG: PA14 domain-containing protein, partial [Chloroflexi bacterium]|nr:PA14 domain-containing protein [Chloroflexota bacterium]
LEVRSRVEETDGVLRLLWRQPPIPLNDGKQATEQESVSEPPLVPISASNLYHGDVRPVGLVGRFFRGIEDPREIDRVLPDAQRVTPGIGGAFWYNSVVEGAHLAIWDGVLNVPEAGLYRLRLNEVHGEMKLILDGETIIDSRSDRETEVELSAGRNRIRLEYVAASGSPRFEVLWTPPGQAESRIAPENLSPAPEYMFRVVK